MVLPAAAWYFPIALCAVFPRYARKHRTPLKMECRSAEGWHGQLHEPYNYSFRVRRMGGEGHWAIHCSSFSAPILRHPQIRRSVVNWLYLMRV